MMKRDKLPDLFIEQKYLSELDKEHEALFTQEPELMEKVKALEEDNRHILAAYPPGLMADRIRSRMGEGKKAPAVTNKAHIVRFVTSPVPLLAAAAIALLVGVVPFLTGSGTEGDTGYIEGIRLKGLKPQVSIFKESDGDVREVNERSLVREHDLLQIEYNAGDYPYGVLLSIDGRGVVTLHFPYSEYDSQELERGANARLPFAYELDDAPYYERFYFLFSKTALPVETLITHAETLAAENRVRNSETLLDLKDVYQTSILLLKEGTK
ncbi:MAG: hypothetical protein JXB03_10640 [Spirochaetales bacterium]|nr:hypothetical protein [Spirochaetales bacterium]